MKLKLVISSLLILILLNGCVSTKRNVVNNIFVSENSPTTNLVVPKEFHYIGNVKHVERHENWRWNKEAFVFIETKGEELIEKRCLTFVTNKINTYFVSNLYGHVKNYISNEYTQINGKMIPTITNAVRPSAAGYITRYAFEKGYASPSIIVLKTVSFPVRKNLLFSVNYSEDVSSLGYSVEEWNSGKLDNKQIEFIREFNNRFNAVVDLSKINLH